MTLHPIGASNRLFYYMCGGQQAAFDISLHFCLKEKLDEELLKKAAAKALANFPEFAIRPVLHQGTVWAMANDAPLPFYPKGSGPFLYGTEETNGYLFVFRTEEQSFTISYFHGLTDFHGIYSFMHTLLYYYAQSKGLAIAPEEGVRLKPEGSADELERLDPYRKFREEISQEKPPAAPPIFEIPEEVYPAEVDYCTSYELSCPLGDFLSAAKAQQTSVSAFIALNAARALETACETGGRDIAIMLSASMHQYYHTDTMVNFSDALTLSYDSQLRALPPSEQGAALKAQLKAQLNKEHFAPLIAEKVALVDGFVSSGLDISQWNRRFATAPKEPAPFTFALAYPGSLDHGPAFKPFLQKVTQAICIRGLGNFGLAAATSGDTMYIHSSQRFDSPAIMQAIAKELEKAGLQPKFRPMPPCKGNQLVPEKLLRRGEN